MKKTLQKKIKGYSLTAGAMIVAGVSADAQIQYSGEINHNISSVNSYFNIDLDGDGVDDFALGLNTTTGGSYTSFNGDINKLEDNNNWMGTGFASALSSGVVVNSAVTDWDPSDNGWDLGYFWSYTNGSTGVGGNFPGVGDKFIGVKFDISGETHYGWIRVNLAADGQTLNIVDWAYEATAGAQISTGDTGTGGTLPECSNISATNISQTSADILVTPNVDGDVYYVLLALADAEPTATEVIAGTGSGGASVVSSGNIAVVNGTEATINITGLTANTEYTAYLVLDDGIVKTLSSVYDTDFSTLTVGIANLKNDNFKIFPNPSNGSFNIKAEGVESMNITISDITGKIIFSKKINSNSSSINLSNVNKGIYNIQIDNGTSIINEKIIIK